MEEAGGHALTTGEVGPPAMKLSRTAIKSWGGWTYQNLKTYQNKK